MTRHAPTALAGLLLWTAMVCAQAAAPPAAPRPYFGLRLTQREGKVEVASVDPLGLARQIGLQNGDVVTHFQGRSVTKTQELLDALKGVDPMRGKGVAPRSVTKDGGKASDPGRGSAGFNFGVERRVGGSVQTHDLKGEIKVMSGADVAKIKTRFPDTKVREGTFYAVVEKGKR